MTNQTKNFAVFGDWHGNAPWMIKAMKRALKHTPEFFIQVGDFGIWKENEPFIRKLSSWLSYRKIPLFFLDGNHENHKVLDSANGVGGRIEIAPNIFYMKRGEIMEWEGLKFLFLGGAYSIDRDWRKLDESYWEEETITQAQEKELIKRAQKVDIAFTHDSPFRMPNKPPQGIATHHLDAAEEHGHRLKKILEKYEPDFVIHGHFHVRHDDTLQVNDSWKTTRICLNKDNTPIEEHLTVISFNEQTKEISYS